MRASRTSVLLIAAVIGACGSAPQASTDADLFFPTEGDPGGASMAALIRGPLAVVNGCVLVGWPGEYALPIWRNGYTARRDDTGRVVVRDPDGAIVAIEGEVFEAGGGYTAEFHPADKVAPREAQVRRVDDLLGYPIPDRCLASDVYGVLLIGETQPLST